MIYRVRALAELYNPGGMSDLNIDETFELQDEATLDDIKDIVRQKYTNIDFWHSLSYEIVDPTVSLTMKREE